MKGEAIGNCDDIRTSHNSFARSEPFVSDEKRVADEDDDVYHFVAYIPYQGMIYELDGLQKGPVLLGEAKDDWIAEVCPHIQSRIQKYASTEIRFNLIALIKNRKTACLEEIKKQEAIVTSADGDVAKETAKSRIAELQATVSAQERQFATWKEENVRRKHNYVPFIMTLLEQLAKHQHLSGLVEKGKEKHKLHRQKAQEAKKKAGQK